MNCDRQIENDRPTSCRTTNQKNGIMKRLFFICFLVASFSASVFAQYGTERTGYEGDYFSLEGALDLFKNSRTLREFERKLNTEENWVNNLDLDYDGRIDYLRVEHRRSGDFHAIILQAVLDRYDVQDVAVIEIELVGRREAVLQIVGDEDLYGEEVIVEPVEGYADSRRSSYRSDYGDYVNVYYWEPVQYILGRQYQVYSSPYRYQYYPTWWRPWVQCSWSIFRPRIVVYHRYYHIVPRHRVIRVHHFYRNYRSYSYNVVVRTNKVRVSHGKAPIHRPRPTTQPGRRTNDYRVSDNRVDQREPNGRSDINRSNAPLSRNGASTTTGPNTTRSRNSDTGRRERTTPDAVRTPSAGPRSTPTRPDASTGRSRNTTSSERTPSRSRSGSIERSSESSPASRPRSTPSTSTPTTKNRNTSPAYESRSRSSSPSINRSSRSTTTRESAPSRSSGSSRSSSTIQRNDRSTSTAPKVSKSSRSGSSRSGQVSRSRTTTRSTTTTRTPSSGSKRSAPAAKSNSGSKSKSSGSKSRSRSGGGE